jgi:hypothetical protein
VRDYVIDGLAPGCRVGFQGSDMIEFSIPRYDIDAIDAHRESVAWVTRPLFLESGMATLLYCR